MTSSFRIPALALVFGALAAAPAMAQTAPTTPPQAGAAATLPNTFDAPPQTATPAAPGTATTTPQVSDVQLAAAAIESVIGQFKAGDIDESLFTPDVAGRLNGQLSTYRTVINGYGALQSIEPQGVFDGLGQFLVVFDNAATQWQIGLDEGGRIAALRFREAPPESSEPAPDA